MKRLYGLVFVTMFATAAMAHAEQEFQPSSLSSAQQQDVLNDLYVTYGVYNDQLLAHVSQNVEYIQDIVLKRKFIIEQELAGLSYKNVFLSVKNVTKVGLFFGGMAVYKPNGFFFKFLDSLGQQLDYQSSMTDMQKIVMVVSFFVTPGIVSAISGFGLCKDIQAMRTKKAALTEELTKINAIVALLQKA